MTAKPPAVLAHVAIAAIAALALACTAPQGSPQPVEPRLGRVVVAPLNLALRTPAELEDRAEPVERAILGYFGGRDRPVTRLAATDANLLWYQVTTELERSGENLDLPTASAAFARRLTEHADYEVLVMPALVVRMARVLGRHASWDGVRRRLQIAHLGDGANLDVGWTGSSITFSGYQGRIAAASLHVSLLTADGEPLHRGLGGLALIQEVRHDDRTPEAAWGLDWRERPFDDPDALHEGIRVAFEPSRSRRLLAP